MKWIGRVCITFFVLLLAAIFLLQTPFAKKLAKDGIITLAKEKGVQLQVESIDGVLPFEWKLKNVNCSYKGEEVSAQVLKFRLAILPLFQQELEVSYLKIEDGRFRGVPFDAVAKGNFDLKQNKTIQISNFLIEGENLFLRLEGKINPDLSIKEGNLAFYLPALSLFSDKISEGSAMGMGQIGLENAKLECFVENLTIEEIPINYSTLLIEATKGAQNWEGNVHLKSGHPEIPLTAQCHFSWSDELLVDDISIKSPEMSIKGEINLNQLNGSLWTKCTDLRTLQPLFPKNYLKGKLDSQIYFSRQNVELKADLQNFAFDDVSAEEVSIDTHIDQNMCGQISLSAQSIVHEKMKLSQVNFKSIIDPNHSPFEFAIKGKWEDPLELSGSGSLQIQHNGLVVSLNSMDGFALKRSIALQSPVCLDWTTDYFKMSNLSMEIGYGHLLSKIDLDKNSTEIKINARELPLEFIPIFYKHFSLAGTSSFDIDLIAKDNTIEGSCNIALERAHFHSEGQKEPYTTKGSLQIHLSGNRAQIHADLKAKDKQFINLIGSFPVRFQHFPFKITIDPNLTFSSQLTAEGKLEDLFNFINIGQNRIEGWVSTQLHGSKTLRDPALQGTFEIQDGLYENYTSGTCLKQIFAKGIADNKMVRLTDLSANDGDKGSLTAYGQLELKPLEHFPFTLTAEVKDFDVLSYDMLSGTCSGEVNLAGNRLGALLKGDLKVHGATFRIPDQMPAIYPVLPIRFVNPPEKVIITKILPSATFPLELDLQIHVPKDGRVEGRGLNAELKGRVHLTGMAKNLKTQGKLQLVSGEYIFSGKVFKLTSGEVIFSDRSIKNAYISLSGNCDLPEVNVTVMLEGPLTSPKLSFQSSPQLPTSSLLAQILFNKDISEISAVQALQVAQTIISLSGNSGPDILEKIRKTLGIDRLTLVTSENDPGKISLQIGKYLMRGVLLTLSQGAESRNVSVEIDLRKGVKFQAEFNEEQQGKFSLKWHHHY
ncbi:MAG: translocation/assembly module TamB [Verrucomicrobia bacterium]|nr:translocation/assembly module TamB [Verrucomicrobiota bacterium]